jgi:DNA mismatch repair protein MutS
VLAYLLETQHTAATAGHGQTRRIAHLRPPRRFSRAEHLVVDHVSLRSLEIEQTMRSGSTDGSLLGVLQSCATPMGKRMLRQWLCYPLADRQAIEQRQRVVGAMMADDPFCKALRQSLAGVQDVQRMISRISVERAAPRDLVGLGSSVGQAQVIAELLADRPALAPYATQLHSVATSLTPLAETIQRACVDAPPAHLRAGGLFRDGYDQALDESRGLERDGNSWLKDYQKELIEQTQISSLKLGYNRVFGYYIEITAAHRDKAPEQWARKQTLKNAERFVTPLLKEYEGKLLSAQDRAIAREQILFAGLCEQVQKQLPDLHAFADIVAQLDVLVCFAQRALRQRYVQPTLVDEPVLHIAAGRHPVLDELLGEQFVPNEVGLGSDEGAAGATLALITGPNMAGKSTYIRQTALIVLMAHTGSFVPADSATIGLCDRIFTRVGASDELHAGQSTFMVEMTETANICHHATESSLVILDEIGRGTSTLDGLSLAWALTEFLAQRRCRCLFATHYHEITALAEQYPEVTNLNVTVREWQDQIVFLHRIVPGATDRSYGIHVAKIAGLPDQVIERANVLLTQLEVSHAQGPAPRRPNTNPESEPVQDDQLSLFTHYLEHPAIEQLRQTDLDGTKSARGL